MRKELIICVLILLITNSASRAEVPIYCPSTKDLLYIYREDRIAGQVRAEDFDPVGDVPEVVNVDRMLCPGTDIPLNGWEYWYYQRGYRHKPVFAVAAYSFLTKRNGEFVWEPYEVSINGEGIK